jgi:folate-dependent phosphoribosylglycinamide formyltransferase PurN
MGNNKNITLFVNDSFFAYCSAKSIIEENSQNISLIVFSNSKSQKKQIFNIFKKVSLKYFIYRGFIHLITKKIFKKKTVRHLAEKHKINTINVVNKIELNDKIENSFIGFAFNFDLILNKEILIKFSKGVFNIHASKLPKDRGISPALWAYARGDKEIWSTIYEMDEGIDTGNIYKQFRVSVNDNDTLFSIYKKISLLSGKVLNSVYNDVLENKIILKSQNKNLETTYLSWPDQKFDTMIKKSKVRLFSVNNLFNI